MTAQVNNFSNKQKKLLKKVENQRFSRIIDDVEEIALSKNFNNDETWFDYSLLGAAIKRQHKTMINYLLKRECRVTRKANIHFDDSPLYLAVNFDGLEIISKLLRKGAVVNDDNYNKRSPLYLALERKAFYIVIAMLKYCNFKNFYPDNMNDINCFHIACLYDDLKIMQKFMKRGFSINTFADCNTEEWHGFSPLHFAVYNRSLKTFDYLMDHGADFFIQTDKGQTSLHLSFYETIKGNDIYGRISGKDINSSLIKKMFQLQKAINTVDSNGLSHFHIICTTGDLENVQMFLNEKIDVNSAVSHCSKVNAGYSALHFAILNSQTKVVELLLNNDADVNKPAKGHLTPLHLACKLQDIEMVRLLLKFGADCTAKDEEERSPLHIAFYHEKISYELIDLLLEKIPKNNNVTDSQGFSHFHIACLRNNLDIVQSFLKHGVSINMCIKSNDKLFPEHSALHLAVRFNKKSLVDLLLKHNANVNIGRKLKPLHLACTFNADKFQDLILNKNNCSSILENHLDIITLLLRYKCDVNVKDSAGKTPLMCILESYSVDKLTDAVFNIRLINLFDIYKHSMTIINLLLNHNADIHTHNNCKESVLHVICKANGNKVELAKLFLNKGADVNAKDEDGLTPLHAAIKCKEDNLAELFLSYNANVNVASKKGVTPLHLAVENKPFSFSIYILLAHGADIHARNENKETPLHMAMSSGCISVIKLLLSSGADINDNNFKGYSTVYYFYKDIEIRRFEITWRIQNIVENHVQKLNALNFHVSNNVKLYCFKSRKYCEEMVLDTLELHDITSECLDELENMKKIRINKYTTLYQILFKDQNQMTRYIKNENFQKILELSTLNQKFPHYNYLIKLQYKRGSERYHVLKPAKDSLNFMTALNLPDVCSEQIFRYLNNENLRNIIEAKDYDTHTLKRKLDTDNTNDQPLNKKKKV